MFKLSSIAAAGFAALAGTGDATAGMVAVEADPASGRLTVDAKDATTDEILRRLSETQNFEVERLGDIAGTATVTKRFSGGVNAVLERVLENESHLVITRSGQGWVRRVVVYGARRVEQAGVERVQPVALSVVVPVAVSPAAAVPAVDAHARKDAEMVKAQPASAPNNPSPYAGHRSAMMTLGSRSRNGF